MSRIQMSHVTHINGSHIYISHVIHTNESCCITREAFATSRVYIYINIYVYMYTYIYTYPPDPMDHVKIFKGWPLQDAPSKLVQLWYKSFPPGRFLPGGNEEANCVERNEVTHDLVRRIRFLLDF